METNYLIIGASHAGLSALEAIRRYDADGSLTLVTAEPDLLYSPTALPYVISGKTGPEDTALRAPDYFRDLDVNLIKGGTATAVDTDGKQVTVNDTMVIRYDKLLVATGATPSIPAIPGMKTVDPLSIRTMADARKIREKMGRAGSALIIGAGFIGMHAAENLANAGLTVTVVEALDQIMPASFDADAAIRIQQAFIDQGITIRTGVTVDRVRGEADGFVMTLSQGREVRADMLLVAAGITPNTGFLSGTGIAPDNGIPVDARMRTGIPGVWAAGDVALAPGFFSGERRIGGTIPTAAEQGKTAGMDMARDSYVTDYPGNLNMNTFNYFGNFAFSVGNVASHDADTRPGAQPNSPWDIRTGGDAGQDSFWKFVFKGDVLTGVSAVNMRFDPGILKELILRRTDLAASKDALVKTPLATGRRLMRELF